MFENITNFYQQFIAFILSSAGLEALMGIAIFSLAICFLCLRPINRFFNKIIYGIFGKRIASFLSFPVFSLILLGLAYQGYNIFNLTVSKNHYINFLSVFMLAVIKTILLFVFFYVASKLIRPLLMMINDKSKTITKTIADWAVTILQVFVWIIFVISALEINGISIAPAIAGLGVVGVAIALSAQDLVKSLIAGMIIVFEGNLSSGDYVILENGIDGTIDKIGIRTTTLISKNKSLINVSNYEFANKSITNITRRQIRRLDWIFGLEYSTTPKQLKTIIKKIKEYLLKSPDFTNPDEALQKVNLEEFADSSINIKVIGFYSKNNYSFMCDARERLLEETRAIVEKAGASFAFPSRTIYKGIDF